MSDSEGKNHDSTVATFSRGSRALGRKHQALLDFRGRDRWLIHGNQSIDVTFFSPGFCFQEVQMMRRFLILSFAVGLLALGGLNAQAGEIPLPATLDLLLPAGSFTVVGPEPDTFSNFTYSTSPVNSAPIASDITVSQFSAGPEAGLKFSGSFFAAAGTTVDYAITYVVTAPQGYLITNSTLSGGFSTFGGTGTGSVSEYLLNAANGSTVGTMEISSPSPPGVTSDPINFAGVNSIEVQKDIVLNGGSEGASISIINQGFSSAVIPEPTSMALLGIGLSGLFTLRRLFRRTSVA